MDNLSYEKDLWKNNIKLIAGIDEVGRGPLVGPVVAAAVILKEGFYDERITDSKKLSEKKREELYKLIIDNSLSFGVGIISPKIIDEVNIYEATKLAMKEALNNLTIKPEHVLIDAMKLSIDIPTTSIIKGDYLSFTIACASIIAKVTRDKMMYDLDIKYPLYGFAKHKGYPTKKHIANVKKYGVLDNYRFTFKPIRDLIICGDVHEK